VGTDMSHSSRHTQVPVPATTATADINQVKADVLPFIRNPKEMGIWSNDYFLQLAQMIRFE